MSSVLLKKLFISTTIIPFLIATQSFAAYLPPVFTDQNRLARVQAVIPMIDKMYRDYAEKNHFPGYAYGIMVDGRLIYSAGSGYADINKKTPANAHTMFRIASMTKSLTAMAILKLRDEGKLKLDDPVYLYIPEIKNQKLTNDSSNMTIRDLLTHSAGFPEDNPSGDRHLADTDDTLLATIRKGISFSNATGTNYEYSNLAFAMLGLIIQKVSGIPYQSYIATNIWKPVGMQQAAWEYTNVPAEQLAHGYRWIDDHWQEEELLHDGIYGAMGGMLTSIDSFSRYVSLHQQAWPPRDDAEAGPIKRSSLREMHHPWRFNNLSSDFKYADGKACPLANAYAYGLTWTRDCDAKVYVGHSGGLPGFGSNWIFMPEYGVGVIMFANVTYASTTSINFQVIDTIIKQAQLTARTLPASAILKERQSELVKLLPDWKEAEVTNIFALNFFLDTPVDRWRKNTKELFNKIGAISEIGEIIPENQLRGYFVIKGTKGNLKISFTLTPETPTLIQAVKIKEI